MAAATHVITGCTIPGVACPTHRTEGARPIFAHSHEDLLFFVDEPEVHLHPGLQRAFMRAVTESPGHSRQVFVATHSNHLLDLAMSSEDEHVALFRVEKSTTTTEGAPHFDVRRVPARHAPLLNDLGVRPSSVFLANCTIWVEGSTDRLHLRNYLKCHWAAHKPARALHEDLHYSFVTYGGASIAGWAFIDEDGTDASRVCARALVIADGDGGRTQARLARLREALQDHLVELPVREIENLVSAPVLARVIDDYEGTSVASGLALDEQKYGGLYLGAYIEEQMAAVEYESTRRTTVGRPYSDSTGTIKDKDAFAQRVRRFRGADGFAFVDIDGISIATNTRGHFRLRIELSNGDVLEAYGRLEGTCTSTEEGAVRRVANADAVPLCRAIIGWL